MNEIVIYPDDILRLKTEEVKVVDERLLKDIKKLALMLEKGENAAGLAATQIGLSDRFFGIKDPDKQANVFINPKIGKTFGEKAYPKIIDKDNKQEDFLEGCLSVPDYYGTVRRYLKIEAFWQEIEDGKLIDRQQLLNGYEAIVFQHELDHLNGILFIDHIKKEGGKFFKFVDKKMIKWDLNKITF